MSLPYSYIIVLSCAHTFSHFVRRSNLLFSSQTQSNESPTFLFPLRYLVFRRSAPAAYPSPDDPHELSLRTISYRPLSLVGLSFIYYLPRKKVPLKAKALTREPMLDIDR